MRALLVQRVGYAGQGRIRRPHVRADVAMSVNDELDASRRFALAAAALANEAALATARQLPGSEMNATAMRALEITADCARELDRLAREGGDLRDAYLIAATALEAASVALAETRLAVLAGSV